MNAKKLRGDLVKAMENALEVYQANKAGGSSVQSVSFDSGRYNGLKEAIEILDRTLDRDLER